MYLLQKHVIKNMNKQLTIKKEFAKHQGYFWGILIAMPFCLIAVNDPLRLFFFIRCNASVNINRVDIIKKKSR